MPKFIVPYFILVSTLFIACSALSSEDVFSSFQCPTTTCDSNENCTAVEQCLFVNSSAPHCQVTDNNNSISCNDIQSRNQLKGENKCQTLGAGTIQSPWCSIEQAASNANGGDLVLVAPGRYLVPGGTHGLTSFSNTGTASKPIVFRNADFDPTLPAIPNNEVLLTPFTEVSGWTQLSEGSDYLICKHSGIAGDATTFNGIATNVKHPLETKPLMRLFSEGCGVSNDTNAVAELSNIGSLPAQRYNEQGHYVQIWNQGTYGGSSLCPTVKNTTGELAVRVEKSAQVTSCTDLALDVTGVGYTIHLQSTDNLCGDLEETLALQGISSENLNFYDDEADHIRFEGLTIQGGNYGLTIETDNIALRYSRVQSSYKDGIKAIGNEAWDYRQPNRCSRIDTLQGQQDVTPSVQDLINYCQQNDQPLAVGQLISPPSCNGDVLNIQDLDPTYFYWDLEEQAARNNMTQARDATIDGLCVGDECVYQSKQHIQKYCREVVPTFSLDTNGLDAAPIPDNCNDFYYFNAQNILIENNDILHNGEEGIDITGGDNWLVRNNTIHDSVVTHGASQMPAGILTKNVSDGNTIESNLLYNIHHSITGILAIGGSPVKKSGASNIVVRNNVLISVSGEKILHMPNCENCAIAHNLMLDLIIGEEGSRGRGLIHVGNHRKSCITSNGVQIDCGGEKRGAAFDGFDNSIVNNVIDLLKWRDADSYRALSFGGVLSDPGTGYVYNGDKSLCVSGNHISGGTGVTPVTTHVNASDVSGLACDLSEAHSDAGLTYTHPRVTDCIAKIDAGELERGQLVNCLTNSLIMANGDVFEMDISTIFTDLSFTPSINITKALGVCSNSTNICSVDEQCNSGTCDVDTTDPNRCTLGPNLTQQNASSDCDLSWTAPLSPVSSTENAYPEFSWKAALGDSEFKFLLYRFHATGGNNNSHWYELLANDTVNASVCDNDLVCVYNAPNLLTDGTYTWKVKRNTTFGWSDWSSTQVFYVSEPSREGHSISEATGIVSPTMSQHVSTDPVLTWQYDPFAQDYSLLLYRYENGYQLLVNLKFAQTGLECSYIGHCKIKVSDTLQLMNSNDTQLSPGTYTWKTKKWTAGQASSWNNTHVFYVD